MDASFPEFLLLFVIGLIVLGPERMSQVAKKIGEFVGYARRMSGNLQRQLEDELEMNRIRESLPKKVDLKAQLGIDEIERDLKSIADDVEGRSDTAKVDDSASADDERDARASDGPGHAYTGADDAIDPEDLTFAREADGALRQRSDVVSPLQAEFPRVRPESEAVGWLNLCPFGQICAVLLSERWQQGRAGHQRKARTRK